MSTLSNTYNLLLSPSSVSLFARHLLPFGRRLFCRRFLCHLDVLPNYRSQPCLILAPNNAPVAADSAAGREGVRSTTEGGKQEANGGKPAFIRAVQAFSCHGAGRQVARATPSLKPAAFPFTTQVLCYFPCTPRATALRQARVSGGNLQNCAPSAAGGGAMTQESNVSPPFPPRPPSLRPPHKNARPLHSEGGAAYARVFS